METLNPNISVNLNPDLSINSLVDLKARGFSVMRSAHVGNLQPYNMALAQAGIPILSVDHTITGVDKNYFPESINTAADTMQVAQLGRLVSRTTVSENIDNLPDGMTFGNLDDLHINAVKMAIPGADIFTNTEYLRKNESVAQEIIRLGAEVVPGLFRRAVNPEGLTFEPSSTVNLLATHGVLQFRDDPRAEETAVLIPNEIDIVINFVIEALTTENQTQYHLSGPDMVTYMPTIRDSLDAIYAAIKTSATFRHKLPNTIDVQLVLSTAARFATTMMRRTQLDNLTDAFEELKRAEVESAQLRSIFFKAAGPKDMKAKDVMLNTIKCNQRVKQEIFAETCTQIPELLVEPRLHGYLTQYDVINEGGLYVSPLNMSLTMTELRALRSQINDPRKHRS